MNRDALIEEILETFDNINIEGLFDKLKLSLKGETMILSVLNRLGGQSTPGEITELFGFTPARLSAIVKSLEAKGHVERIHNADDRRTSTIILTGEGTLHYLKYREEAIRNVFVMIEELGEADVQAFLRIIRRISDISKSSVAFAD